MGGFPPPPTAAPFVQPSASPPQILNIVRVSGLNTRINMLVGSNVVDAHSAVAGGVEVYHDGAWEAAVNNVNSAGGLQIISTFISSVITAGMPVRVRPPVSEWMTFSGLPVGEYVGVLV